MKLINHRTLFLIDSIGALVSSIAYGFILTKYRDVFGFSEEILVALACLAFTYFLYSGACYWMNPKLWRPFLSTIAVANLLHCCLSIYFICSFYDDMERSGLIYFLGELAIILLLAVVELKVAFSRKT